jgi:hypothetical protein
MGPSAWLILLAWSAALATGAYYTISVGSASRRYWHYGLRNREVERCGLQR